MPFHADWHAEVGPVSGLDAADIPAPGTDEEQKHTANPVMADLGEVGVARTLLGEYLAEVGLGAVGIAAKLVAEGQEVVDIAVAGNCN